MSTTEARNITADRELKKAADDLVKRAGELDCHLKARIKAVIDTAETCGEMAEAYHVNDDEMHDLWYHACKPTLELTVGFTSEGPLNTMDDYDTLYQYCVGLLFDPKRFTHQALGLPEPTVPFQTYSMSDVERCSCAVCIETGRVPLG